MNKPAHAKKTFMLVLTFLLVLTGCGQERPPLEPVTPATPEAQPQSADPKEKEEPTEYDGNSKPLDYSPCEGIHVSAEAGAFWKDTIVQFTPIEEENESIRAIEEKLYEEEGFIPFAGFEVDAGLEDDEIIPGQYDVAFDLSSEDIGLDLYDFLKVYRIGDNGDYYELNAAADDGILRFSCNQNSAILIGGSIILAVTALSAAGKEYYDRNVYFIGSGRDVLSHEGKNIFGKWKIEWTSADLDSGLADKLARMREIENRCKREAEQHYSDEIYSANNPLYLKQQIFDYTLTKIKEDAEHTKIREEIRLPKAVTDMDAYIGNAFRYLYQEEHMRMPLYRVPFKCIRDNKPYYGLANNRALSSAYIDINLNMVDPANKNDMYNLQMTLAHELLHICQIRYRLPIDAISDNTRYDEMVAQAMEADALAYFIRKGIIPETEKLDLTRSDWWGNLRLPINGEEDSNVDKGIRQDEIINCGYNLGSFLRYLKEKTGKKLTCHQIMKGRSYFTGGKVSSALCSAFDIEEREFDLHFRNWIISNRKEIGDMACGLVVSRMYGLGPTVITKKGEKYHIDLIHGNSYFLNLHSFETENKEEQTMILAVDEELNEVFPSTNVGTGIPRKVIRAGHYFDKLPVYAGKIRNLSVLEIQGDSSDQDRSKNAGYTVYVLDKTPKVELAVTEEKLEIRLPKPELVVEDKIADGYLLKITTDNDLEKTTEIPVEKAGKTFQINRVALYDGNTDRDVTVTAVLNEFFLDEAGNKIMGIESDEVKLLIPKLEKEEPEKKEEQTPAIENSEDNPNSIEVPEGGYWKLKETNIRKAEDEHGTDGYASNYYSASELTHSKRTTVPKTDYHDSGYANQEATCTRPPQIIVPGKPVVMVVSVTDSHGGDCGLRSVYASVSYGKPDDNRTDIMYNAGIRFSPVKEGGENSAYLDTIGNTPCPLIEVLHDFEKGHRAGEEIAILFHGALSSTLWIYEWVEQ